MIAPAQIGDLVKVAILANGQSTESEYSVAKYCAYLIANYSGENARAVRELAKATLEYGRAANDYFAGTRFCHASEITTITEAAKAESITAAQATKTLSAEGGIRSKLASAAFMALTKPEFRFYTTGLTEAVVLSSKITTNVVGVTAKRSCSAFRIQFELSACRSPLYINKKPLSRLHCIKITVTACGNTPTSIEQR